MRFVFKIDPEEEKLPYRPWWHRALQALGLKKKDTPKPMDADEYARLYGQAKWVWDHITVSAQVEALAATKR